MQLGRNSSEDSEFIYLFTKGSAFINTGILLKNYKICARGNWSQCKDKTDIFEGNENVDVKKNDRTTVDSDYNSDNIWKVTYLAIGYVFFIASKVDCHLSYISHFLWSIKIQLCELDFEIWLLFSIFGLSPKNQHFERLFETICVYVKLFLGTHW